MLTIEDLKKMPKIQAFRFDTRIFTGNSEYEETLSALTQTVVEGSDSVKLRIVLPEDLTPSAFSMLLSSLSLVTKIEVDHLKGNNEMIFMVRHSIMDYDGWSMVTSCTKPEILVLEATYSSVPSVPTEQSIEGLSDWLNTVNKRGE